MSEIYSKKTTDVFTSATLCQKPKFFSCTPRELVGRSFSARRSTTNRVDATAGGPRGEATESAHARQGRGASTRLREGGGHGIQGRTCSMPRAASIHSHVFCMCRVPRSNSFGARYRRWDAEPAGTQLSGADVPVGIPHADVLVVVPSRRRSWAPTWWPPTPHPSKYASCDLLMPSHPIGCWLAARPSSTVEAIWP